MVAPIGCQPRCGCRTWIAGVLFDATGSYGTIFILSFTALSVAIALFWLVPEMRVAGARNQKNQAANWGSDRGSDPNTG